MVATLEHGASVHFYLLQGKLMFSEAVHNRPHGYSVTAHPCYGALGTHPTGMISCSSLLTETISE